MTPSAFARLLPVAPRPAADERLSSWLSRTGRIYGLTADALLAGLGLKGATARALEAGLSAGQGDLIAVRAGLDAAAVAAMTFSKLVSDAQFLVAPNARYFCPDCAQTPQIGRRGAALPWTFWCSVHGVRLWAREERPLESFVPADALERLDPLAKRGAARMAAWAEGCDSLAEAGLPTVSALLRFLGAPYRRPSPPSLAEQPRLSTEARRANHAFLTQPITRQALLVVVPEYDRFAPVLAKPVRVGLDALAGGTLLQNYALAVAVARLTENPVGQAVATLAAADADGETGLRWALRTWPAPLRRRIGAALKRTLRGGSTAKIAFWRPATGRLPRSPANYGAFRPANCESESGNYARSGRAAP